MPSAFAESEFFGTTKSLFFKIIDSRIYLLIQDDKN